MELKEEFKEMIRALPGIDAEGLLRSLSEKPTVSIRINSRKPGAYFQGQETVSWNPNAFYLPFRPDFIFDPLFHAGTYYVQEASSSILETIVRSLSSVLGCRRLNVLDLCAAPGGKTTAIINALDDGSFIWANELIHKRNIILRENLAKWGYDDIKITEHPSSFFASGDYLFDIVLVDAPCSGEGMMRKEDKAVEQWSEDLVEKCSLLQRDILKDAVKCVKPGGFLIYSTCTFNMKENEENALYIFRNLNLQPFRIEYPKESGISESLSDEVLAMRFMPHLTKGEGLFVSVFRKEGDWEPSKIEFPKDQLKIKTGKKDKRNDVKKKLEFGDNIPPIEEILSCNYDKSRFPFVNLNKEEALSYLKGNPLFFKEEIPKGFVVVGYEDHPLGMVKNIGQRANNLYPKAWRIKKQ